MDGLVYYALHKFLHTAKNRGTRNKKNKTKRQQSSVNVYQTHQCISINAQKKNPPGVQRPHLKKKSGGNIIEG
jgi:hypothetical protein